MYLISRRDEIRQRIFPRITFSRKRRFSRDVVPLSSETRRLFLHRLRKFSNTRENRACFSSMDSRLKNCLARVVLSLSARCSNAFAKNEEQRRSKLSFSLEDRIGEIASGLQFGQLSRFDTMIGEYDLVNFTRLRKLRLREGKARFLESPLRGNIYSDGI